MGAVPGGVVLPATADVDNLAKVLDFIEAHSNERGTTLVPNLFLSGPGEDDRVELTAQLHAILSQVVLALSQGQAISILTRDQEVSTQEAADILGLSRPTVVKLINEGELPAYVPGSVRRKLRLADVLAYREDLRARRNQFITDSSAEYDDADGEGVVELLAEARKRR